MSSIRLGSLALAVCIPVAFAALPACSHHSNTQPSLIASASSPIADVPVPAGFSMESNSTSSVVASSSLRIVDHYYKGSDDFLPVVHFYRDQMPQKGWNLLDQNQAGEKVTLHFSKNSEECYVAINSGTFDSHIRVQIFPVGTKTTTAAK